MTSAMGSTNFGVPSSELRTKCRRVRAAGAAGAGAASAGEPHVAARRQIAACNLAKQCLAGPPRVPRGPSWRRAAPRRRAGAAPTVRPRPTTHCNFNTRAGRVFLILQQTLRRRWL